ncbi:uncharacterized protein F5147DRAFT_775674 [Suillus discolor]|uniref:DUF6533 domain-containing protein n=1 Tax=Suillus discolor TaxID=1912936 RepID=A0A9P7F2G2_9AGAM|nr:uncharacterized protein F5147DRAFT_775674 [Suillus discolor]KAG2104411.1 hypothetical protein F5147DRAFT_775674 [Suillus discolor]
MTYVSDDPDNTYVNDPAWWPFLVWTRAYSNAAVVASVVVVYDWALTSGQEFELVWKQRLSLMNLLYISVRYVGILYAIISFLGNFFYSFQTWTPVVVNAMLAVIMTTRIYAMFQQSKPILIFLVIALLASTIASGVMLGIGNIGISGKEFVLSGYHICLVQIDTYRMNLNHEMVIPIAIWEILAFLLAVWIVILRFYEIRQSQSGSTIGDCFTMLIKSHALYFLAFATVACFNIGDLAPGLRHSTTVADDIYAGALRIARVLQMFVLGPRLILSIREYHSKLATRSDGGINMTAIAFQALRRRSTSSDMELDTIQSTNPV